MQTSSLPCSPSNIPRMRSLRARLREAPDANVFARNRCALQCQNITTRILPIALRLDTEIADMRWQDNSEDEGKEDCDVENDGDFLSQHVQGGVGALANRQRVILAIHASDIIQRLRALLVISGIRYAN